MADFASGPSFGAIQSSMMAGVGGNPAAGGWVSGMINKGAAGYSPQGKGYGNNPIPSPFGNLLFSGPGSKPGQQSWVQKLAASIKADFQQAGSAGNANLQQGVAAASQVLQQNGVQIASADQIYGSAPGGGSWASYVSSRGMRGGGMDFA